MFFVHEFHEYKNLIYTLFPKQNNLSSQNINEK